MPEEPPENTIRKIEKVYTPDDLPVLKGLEPVRAKPGMYLGGTDERALHQCVSELLDNSIIEFLSGRGTEIHVTIHVDDSVTVQDHGHGIPVETDEFSGRPKVEALLTTLYVKPNASPYCCYCGVGAKCVNALSEWFKVEVRRDGQVYAIGFERGKTTQPLKIIGPLKDQEPTGTTITFKPDSLIFQQTTEFKTERLRLHLWELAFIHPPLTFHFLDERIEGMRPERIQHRPAEFPAFAAPKSHFPLFGTPLEFTIRRESLGLRVVLQYAQARGNEIYYYVNRLPTPQGGTLRAGFLQGLARACMDFSKADELPEKFSKSDAECGLHALVALTHPDPKFEGSTKEKLFSSDARPFAAKVVARELKGYFRQHPEIARQIISHILHYRRK